MAAVDELALAICLVQGSTASPASASPSATTPAQELHHRGHHVAVPAPPGTAVVGGWRAWTDAVVGDVGTREAAVIVGRSGAGPLLSVTLDRYFWLFGRVRLTACRLD